MIGPLATTEAALSSEYRRRRKAFDERRIQAAELEEALAEGWTVTKLLKNGAKVHKAKTIDEILENQVWCILYELGYSELNETRHFKIVVSTKDEGKLSKQIDVFARDDETIIVVECKCAGRPSKRALQKDIGEYASLQKAIAIAARKHYHASKPKIIWLFVTKNIIWSEQDLNRAKEQNIRVLREKEIRYLAEISKSIGKAAKYQFHAEFLASQRIPALQDKKVAAVRMKLGGHVAYNFSVRADDLLKVSFVNHRDLRDPSGSPSYQRLIKPARLRKIASFLEAGGYFPNSIIVNFKVPVRFDIASASESDIKFGHLYLPDTYKSCWIVDGQHRLYSCALAELKHSPTVSVIAFEKLPVSEEAELFTTINREQRPVTRKLLDELEGELKWDSPVVREQMASIASRAIDMLRTQIGGPFHDRIATPGIDSTPEQCLTLPEIRRSLLQAGLIGRVVGPKKIFVPGPFTGPSNEETLHASFDALSGYFEKIRAASIERWDRGRPGYLCTNFGVQGHVRLLGSLIHFAAHLAKVDAQQLTLGEMLDLIDPYLKPITEFARDASDEDFEKRFKVKLGSGGQKAYYFKLCELVHAKWSEFQPEGLTEFFSDTSREARDQANLTIGRIQEAVHRHVVAVLKENFKDAYLDKGVPNVDVHQAATAKRLQVAADERQPLEVYFDFIDLKKIVEHKNNWPLFKEVLSIRLPVEQKNLQKYVAWFDRINELRRIAAHPFGRAYTNSDLEVIELIESELEARLPVEA